MNSANILSELGTVFFPSWSSRWKCILIDTLIIALWHPKQKIQLSHAWNPDPWKQIINVWHFKLLGLGKFFKQKWKTNAALFGHLCDIGIGILRVVLYGWQCLQWYSSQRIIVSQGKKERMDYVFSYVCSFRTEFSRVPLPQLVVANSLSSHWLEFHVILIPNWPLVGGIMITWLTLASPDLCPEPRESLATSITCDHLRVEQNWGFGGKKKRAGNDVGRK